MEGVFRMAGNVPGGSFVLRGDVRQFQVDPVELKGCGLKLERTVNLGEFFDVAGHRTVVIGREGGDCEIWTYPFQAVKQVGFEVVRDGVGYPLAGHCHSFEILPEASRCHYRLSDAELTFTIFAPLGHPAALFIWDVRSDQAVTLRARAVSDLKLMWPADTLQQNPEVGTDDVTGAWVLRSTASSDAVVLGWTGGDREELEPSEGLSHSITLPAGGNRRCIFVVAGSTEGAEDARAQFGRAVDNLAPDWADAVDYYTELLSGRTQFASSSSETDEAFQWAVVGMDKCFVRTPDLGAGYVAGYNHSGDGGRPGFGWYFGRDSSWTGFAANCYADFANLRENIRLLAKYQIAEGNDRGKIYHELSAAHDRIPGANYAFPAGDSTPFFVADLADYHRWTGDTGFVVEMWEPLERAMEWCYRMDVDGDSLIDNPPAGHQWYDYGEKNMVDLVAIWARALEGAAYLGEVTGRGEVQKWRQDAAEVVRILNTAFWNERNSYLYDRKLPDGSMSELTTCNPTIPLLWNMVEPEKAGAAIQRMGQPDLTIEWGLRTNSDKDSIYSPHGYHEGTVWPLCTGWGSLAAFANGDPELGWRLLDANVRMTRDWCLGYITEVVDGGQRVPGGCPHQAWSEAMVILPVVQGIFGVRPESGAEGLEITAVLPQALEHASLKQLQVGTASYEIGIRRSGKSVTLTVSASVEGRTVKAGILVPAGAQGVRVTLDGRNLGEGEIMREARGNSSRVGVAVQTGADAVTLTVAWQ